MNVYKPRLLMSRWLCAGLLLLTIGLCAKTLLAQEMTLELDPATTRIEFTLGASLHTVHGTFALKSGTIHFNASTGAASGLVVVDATSGDSGNKGRDHKMHKEILESQRYPEVTFTPTKLSGKVELQGDSSVQVDGIFRLHGTDHPMTLTLPVQTKGNNLSARTHIVIPYVAWGLKNPSTFILRVSDKVNIDITAAGRVLPQGAQPAEDH
ncbi:MAG TPA: YceI family protein [Terriglobales bacterium]|nr:YceI family protein [Terriglobales bacterium]